MGLPVHLNAGFHVHPAGLHYLDFDWEADEFMQFIADLESNGDGAVQIMYGIDGTRDLTESTRDDLSGYAGARPVRIGNGAFDQRQNDVSSKLMCWVALDRASKVAGIRGDRAAEDAWRATAEEIRADILAYGVKKGVLRQHYDTEALDASTLLAAVFGFLPRGDVRLRATVDAIASDLTKDSFDTSTGRHLGNFPQAFSHLALIEAAGRIILHERMRELM